MKFNLNEQARNSGSVLVVTLVLAAILGVTLGGYLYWVRTQNLLVAQSQAWNAALAMAEAGVEEAMAQINVNLGTNYIASAQANWGGSGGVFGPRTNSLLNGSYSTVIIRGAPGPTIISTGYAQVSLMSKPAVRTVRVTTSSAPLFGNAMTAINNVVFNGNNMSIDSYDSADPTHSTNGMYYAPWRKAGGDVASTFGTVTLNNATIKGRVRTGPTGSFDVGPGGSAGDLPWTGPGIQPGWYDNDFNMEVKDVTPLNTSSFVAPSGSGIPGDTNIFILGSGGYLLDADLIVKGGENVLVLGNAILYVTGEVKMSGPTSTIMVAPGGSLKLYCAGANCTMGGVNVFGNASAFQYYGLPTNKSLSWSGNDIYVGCVYAPQAVFACGGGGFIDIDYQGSCVVKSVVLNGHFNFHYDENLRRIGPKSGFVVSSWAEL